MPIIPFTPRLNRTLSEYIPQLEEATVIKVYDGDTITVASHIPNTTNDTAYKFSVRLRGIDTPELRTKNADEKQIAYIARDILRTRILGKTVQLSNISKGKYGRLVCDVHHEGMHVNDWLIEQRLAVVYMGGRKASPSSWSAYYAELPAIVV
jgi:endonuclease YncB( thermonuclease family)